MIQSRFNWRVFWNIALGLRVRIEFKSCQPTKLGFGFFLHFFGSGWEKIFEWRHNSHSVSFWFAENETEISFFRIEDYEQYKSCPEHKWWLIGSTTWKQLFISDSFDSTPSSAFSFSSPSSSSSCSAPFPKTCDKIEKPCTDLSKAFLSKYILYKSF